MLSVEKLFTGQAQPELTLTMSYEKRQKSRQRVVLDDGTEVAIRLQRGTALKDGDVLEAGDGTLVLVRAAVEELSVVNTSSELSLARAAYHLGNRHVPLQIRPGQLAYLHDHVLDQMLRNLGLDVTFSQAPFEPEAGAYGAHTHSHDHGSHGSPSGDTGQVPAHAEGHDHEHDHRADEVSSPDGLGPQAPMAFDDEDTPVDSGPEFEAEDLTEPNFKAPFFPG